MSLCKKNQKKQQRRSKTPSFNSNTTPKHKCNLSWTIPLTFQVEWILCLQNLSSQISLPMLRAVYKDLITNTSWEAAHGQWIISELKHRKIMLHINMVLEKKS